MVVRNLVKTLNLNKLWESETETTSLALVIIYSYRKHLLMCISISVCVHWQNQLMQNSLEKYMEQSQGERDVCAGGRLVKGRKVDGSPASKDEDLTHHKMIMKIYLKKNVSWNFWLQISAPASAQLFIWHTKVSASSPALLCFHSPDEHRSSQIFLHN